MSAAAWRVVKSGEVADSFRRAAEEARRRGRLGEFRDAATWALSELERTPQEFGEGRGRPPRGTYELRLAVVRPVSVEYAVFPAAHTVLVRRFSWAGGK